jgi:hypothetical protein
MHLNFTTHCMAWRCVYVYLPQAPEPHSDSRAVPAAINWDLGNAAAWEAVLDMHQSRWGHIVHLHTSLLLDDDPVSGAVGYVLSVPSGVNRHTTAC